MVYIRRNRIGRIPVDVCCMPQKEKKSLDFRTFSGEDRFHQRSTVNNEKEREV